MLQSIRYLFLICVVFNFSCQEEKAAESFFDFSGIEQFIEIAGILEQGQEPSENQWEKLFSTPGYEVLTESEFSREFFIEHLRMVFLPAEREALEQALEKEKNLPFHRRHAHHFNSAKNKMDEIVLQKEQLNEQAPELMEISRNEAMNYLPEMEETGFVPVSFVIFSNDARGYTPVVIDILFSIGLGDNLPLLVGHEVHHYFRNQILAYDPDTILAEDKDLLWVLNQIQAEGIADQIDKRKLVMDVEGPMHSFSDLWENMVKNAPDYLSFMDEHLSGMQNTAKDRLHTGQQLKKNLPMSGHPIGFYMANLILEEKGTKALAEEAGNPFAFFRKYQQVAKAQPGDAPVFSSGAMRVISDMEEKYIND